MFSFVLFIAMNLLLCNILHLLSQVRIIHELFFCYAQVLLPLLLGARMSCLFFWSYKILLSMLRARMMCNSSCCCKISLLLPLTIVNLLLLLTQKCYKLLITPLECCYHCCHVQKCQNLKSIFMWSSCIRVTSWSWQVTIELFGNFFICQLTLEFHYQIYILVRFDDRYIQCFH